MSQDSIKVLHILYQSLPQISGSSIRSRDLLMSQKELGLDVLAVTSPFQAGTDPIEIYNGIKYIRTSLNQSGSISDEPKNIWRRIIRFWAIIPFYFRLSKIIKNERPDIVHAHAMFFCGIPGILLGRKYDIPVVYEVRSLWMLRKSSEDTPSGMGRVEQFLLKLEKWIMKRAGMVIVINQSLKNELVKYGISAEKIKVVKNAVNTTLIKQLRQESNEKVVNPNDPVFGYIGTLTPHEGIDLLIRAFKEVKLKLPKASLRIYGDGISGKEIKDLANDVCDVHYCGQIAPQEVAKAFSSIDIIVNPRYKNKLTDSVTPLKPLEAMAYRKLFIGSNVGGILELVEDESTGFLFEAGQLDSLVNTMLRTAQLPVSLVDKTLDFAENYVIKEKSWIQNAKQYHDHYKTLLG